MSPAKRHGRPKGTSIPEWILAALGGTLLLAALAYLTWWGLTHPERRPELRVDVLGESREAGGHHTRFRVRNDGSGTAATVTVVGIVSQDGREIDRSETTLDYVPERSEREGGLIFPPLEAGQEIRLRIEGYSDP
ncbi:hypothetical protein [Rhodospirillum rubrum]|uniref:TIGR02588 family protein n=1 Tax=Rhodospirillum rubrum (strain ATCC 11170 / ATH 1.1.1 / DSM 467 / LMG 4362 / NCIMB 8255 / S1) TaxID=269796 RepID=Q2RSV5_RHORT|nr:hypothetical protein [Rhodospirillum rubrum]ABC22790.1 conserved hypothetical protein [Rhodospirillum rubrum ATCC 11170]AEO48511.1 hypothetical protein F11_10225 [Rhodospirillum rubrum F11]MBK5954387.1 hypothetical protein [Rhodospirillum rubrum]QXG78779.1 hypothetical protein KUL73_10285 [Rhodospirillum rubrum]HAP98466.1 hypothetical protein [Rhodospirillum rubrum]